MHLKLFEKLKCKFPVALKWISSMHYSRRNTLFPKEYEKKLFSHPISNFTHTKNLAYYKYNNYLPIFWLLGEGGL